MTSRAHDAELRMWDAPIDFEVEWEPLPYQSSQHPWTIGTKLDHTHNLIPFLYAAWVDENVVEWSNEPTLHYLRFHLRDTRVRRNVVPRPPRVGGYPPDDWAALLPRFGYLAFRHIGSINGCVDIELEFLDESADIEVYLTVGQTQSRMSDPAARQRSFHICNVEAGTILDVDVRQPSHLTEDDDVVEPDPEAWCTPFTLKIRIAASAVEDVATTQPVPIHISDSQEMIDVTTAPPFSRGLMRSNWHQSLSAFTVGREGFDHGFLKRTCGRSLDAIFSEFIAEIPPSGNAVAPTVDAASQYLVLFTPRSGSTHLTELLCATAACGFPHELMTYYMVTALMSPQPMRMSDYCEHVAHLFSTSNHVSGFEIDVDRYFNTWSEILAPKLNLRRIIFERNNFLQQAVSLYMATEFGIWHDPKPEQLAAVNFVPEQFLSVSCRLVEMILRIETHISSSESEWLRVTHEDVVADPIKQIGRIMSFVGVSRYRRETGLAKLKLHLDSDSNALTPTGTRAKSTILAEASEYLAKTPRTRVDFAKGFLSLPQAMSLPEHLKEAFWSHRDRFRPLASTHKDLSAN